MEFNRDIVSLRQLRVLYLLVQYGSVKSVANILDITQPAVSRMLTALEKDSPHRLFHRKKNRLTPTSYAIELSEMVHPVLQSVEKISDYFYAQQSMQQRVLNIALPSNVNIILSAVLENFHTRTKGRVQVNTYFTAVRNVVEQVVEQHSHLGIVAYEMPTNPDVEVVKFAESPVCCVVHCNHILSRADVIKFSYLANENIIVSAHAGSSTRTAIEQQLRLNGADKQVTYGVDTFIACDLARRQVGITLTSTLTAKTFFEHSFEVAIIPLEKTIIQPFSWVIPSHTPHPNNNMLLLMEEMAVFVDKMAGKTGL